MYHKGIVMATCSLLGLQGAMVMQGAVVSQRTVVPQGEESEVK